MLESQDFSRSTAGNRRDIGYLCQLIMLRIQSSPPRWVQHECSVPGCKEGMVTIDCNEKLTRGMCAAPKEKTKCPVNHINLVQCCSRSPVTGGRHQSSSKYCSIHQHLRPQRVFQMISSLCVYKFHCGCLVSAQNPHTPCH